MRKSWDTSVKHLARLGLLHLVLSPERYAEIPSTNLWRWRHEPIDKYKGSDLNELLKQELDLIVKFCQSTRIKNIYKDYLKLIEAFHFIVADVKNIKAHIKSNKAVVVNTIDRLKNNIPIDLALKLFNISRTTYQNYKSIVIHQCEASYFKRCSKRFATQLLPTEVETIKTYMTNIKYRFWSKSSIYIKAVRANVLHCSDSTFYNYCRILGFKNKPYKKKSDHYKPKRTTKPNELWCADVTIFKTGDGKKHYIHILMDHYSKMILGYRIEKSNSGKAIAKLLRKATLKYKPKSLHLLTDGGTENINVHVSSFFNRLTFTAKHIVAQKDVVYSNAMIEALNKIIKHQFLYPKQINSKKQLIEVLKESVFVYNKKRPSKALNGNTPFEMYTNSTINFNLYKKAFATQRKLRVIKNTKSHCTTCFETKM